MVPATKLTPNISSSKENSCPETSKSQPISTSYRGFQTIDQEMGREIALEWFKATEEGGFKKKRNYGRNSL